MMAKVVCDDATCRKDQQLDPCKQRSEEEANKGFEEQVKVEVLKSGFKVRHMMLSDIMMGFFIR